MTAPLGLLHQGQVAGSDFAVMPDSGRSVVPSPVPGARCRKASVPQCFLVLTGQDGRLRPVASYSVNRQAVTHCRRLIDGRQYVLDSDWGEVQPDAAAQNAYLESHSWEDYARWHLGLTEGARDETKARYAFVYGDFRRVHRTGLIACVYRAAEWRHKDVELAAHDLLQHLDKTSG